MIRYIVKKYLSADGDHAAGRKRVGLTLSLLSIGLNLLLFGIKCFAGSVSGSIAITADGFNNLADTGACLMVVLGLQLSDRKPCRRYPCGYGRFEYLSGMLIGGVVLFLGGRLMAESIAKIIHPEPIDGTPVVIIMMALSIIVKGYMYLYNRRIGALINSAGMKAASLDALSDCIATLAIIAAIIIEDLTGLNIDGWTGALVAMCILWAGLTAVRDSLAPLLGRGVDKDAEDKIRKIAQRHRSITQVHGIALHDYGPQRKLITMLISVSGDEAGAAAQLREEIRAELGYDAVIGIGDKEIPPCGILSAGTVKNNNVRNRERE